MQKSLFLLLVIFLFITPATLFSQVNGTPPVKGTTNGVVDKNGDGAADEEEDDDDDAGWEAKPAPVAGPKYSEVKIFVEGKEWQIGPEFIAKRGGSMAIHIERLLPNSFVRLEPAVAGIEFKSRRFQANELGILDLGVETGTKKGQGNLRFTYSPSSGETKTISVKLKLE